MSELAIEPNGQLFRAAVQSGPFLVIAAEDIRGFRNYSEAEAYARNQESLNSAQVTIGRARYKDDGTPYRVRTFPTTEAGCSFERARRELGM